MNPAASAATPPPQGRRCRARERPAPLDDGLRPTDVIGAFFLAGVGMILAGAIVAAANAVEPWSWGRWLALHLVFVGGISQLVLGASQFFAGAFLATDPPARSLIRTQLAGWNIGALALAVAVPAGSKLATYLAAICLIAVLGAYAVGFLQMRRRSLGSAPWASRWYLAAAAFFAVGIVAGAMLATGVRWGSGDLLAAHMVCNVAGWFGTAIVGTLHTFFPSLTRSRLRLPRLQAPTFTAWTLGTAALAVGHGFSIDGLAVGGWLALLVAAAMIAVNILGSLLAAARPLSLPARMVAAAQCFLLAGLLVAAADATLAGPTAALAGSTRAAVGTLLIAGWVGLTVVGSLLHLLALLVRVRDLRRGMPEPRPSRDRAVTALAAAGVGAVAAGQLVAPGDSGVLPAALLISAYFLLGVRLVRLGGQVLTTARPRI